MPNLTLDKNKVTRTTNTTATVMLMFGDDKDRIKTNDADYVAAIKRIDLNKSLDQDGKVKRPRLTMDMIKQAIDDVQQSKCADQNTAEDPSKAKTSFCGLRP